MRKFLAFALAIAMAIAPAAYGKVSSFGKKAHDASVALMRPDRSGALALYCSGTVIETPDGIKRVLTARHCVVNEQTGEILSDAKVTFADNEQGPFFDTAIEAVSETEDLALLRVINGGNLPSVRLGDETKMQPGDPLFLWSYPRGIGKVYTTGSFVAPKFPANLPFLLSLGWQNAMPLQDVTSYGSSGSGIFSDDQHALIGVTVGFFPPDFNIKVAEPVSRVKYLLAHLDQNSAVQWAKLHPKGQSPAYDPDDD